MTRILFLCPHGAVKSVIASAWMQRLADSAGLEVQTLNAGTEPDPAVPQKVIDFLAADGLDVRSWQPRLVSPQDLERADRVISLGCDLQSLGVPAEKSAAWSDVPLASQGLPECRDAIYKHLERLVGKLKVLDQKPRVRL